MGIARRIVLLEVVVTGRQLTAQSAGGVMERFHDDARAFGFLTASRIMRTSGCVSSRSGSSDISRLARNVTARSRVRGSVEPIPETLEALDEVQSYLDDGDLEQQLRSVVAHAERLAPGLVGVSLAFRDNGLTFTLIATDEEIATLDAVQYVTSGPCVDAIDLGHGIATPDGLLSEQRWHDFARASSAAGVRSTLTLPVVDEDVVVSTVNLYGRAEDTFAGKHEVLAHVFGAWAPGAIANADLSFATRQAAQRAPTQLREEALVDTAVGMLAAERGVSVQEARTQIHDAAQRAGVPVHSLARVLLRLYDDR